jgi:hypothetical protein
MRTSGSDLRLRRRLGHVEPRTCVRGYDGAALDHDALVAVAQVNRVQVVGRHQLDEALEQLDVEKAGAFAAQVREIRGDALLAKGDAQGARAEYAAALAGDTKGEIDRATVELKLRDVGGDVPAAPKPKTAPAAKGDS